MSNFIVSDEFLLVALEEGNEIDLLFIHIVLPPTSSSCSPYGRVIPNTSRAVSDVLESTKSLVRDDGE